jgi:PAS domain S-box-containing protein
MTESLRETIGVFGEEGEPLTTSEVAESLGIGRRSTYDRLERLVEAGHLETKKVGASARVWWQPGIVDSALDGVGEHDGTGTGTSATSDGDGTGAGEAAGVERVADPDEPAPSALERLVENVPGMVYRCRDEPGWPMSFVSEAAREVTGYEPAAIESGEVSYGVDLVHAADREPLREAVHSQLAEGDRFRVEYRIRTREGDVRRIREHGCAVREDGERTGVLEGVIMDVTEEKESIRALEEREQQFRSLVEATEEYAIFMLDPDGYVRTWNPGAERINGYEAEDIVGEHFSTFYTREEREAGVPDENLAAAAAEGSTEDEGWRLRADGTLFWARITVTAIRDDEGDLEGFAKVTRDMTDRREHEQNLRHERDFTKRILETAPVGVLVVEADGNFVTANERADELLGRESAEGKQSVGINDVYDEAGDFIQPVERPYVTVFEDGEGVRNWIAQLEVEDGSRRWLSTNVEPMIDEGEVEQALVTVQDVTQLKTQAQRLERQRDEIESEFEEVFERVADAFYAVDEEFRFTYVNERAAELLQAEPAELLGESVWDEFPDARETPVWDAFHEALETQEPTSFELYYEPLSFWLEANVYPSESGLSIYFRDVTERKEREQELVTYETLFAESKDVSVVVDADGTFTTVSPSSANVFGYEPEELVGEVGFDYIHPDDREEAMAEFARMVEEPGYEPRVEFRFQRADGSWIVIEAMARNLLDDPDIGGIVVYTRDVTERTHREGELELYEEIVETVDDGIYALDEEGRYRLVNEAYCELTGYDRHELLGAPAETVYDESLIPEIESITEEIRSGERPSGKFRLDILRKDGVAVPCETTFTTYPIGDGDGRCGVVRDVSERLEREEELRTRVRQQEVVTELGERALEDRDLDDLMARAAERVAETLDTDYCKVLDLDGERRELLLRQGVGWHDGIVGSATVAADEANSQAAYTLTSAEPVRVRDLSTETRFDGPALLTDHDVRSGISVVVGSPDDPWGILGTHDRSVREFTRHDVNFVQAVANVLATAIDRHDYEGTLLEQREQLATLINLHEVVGEVTDAIIDQPTRDEIEETVCERLAASESYALAWIGDVDGAHETVRVRTEAGVSDYLEDLTISVDPDDERGEGPTGSALRTGQVQTTADVRGDERFQAWRDEAEAYGFRSSAAIPIVYDGTTYGALNIYSERPNAFRERERDVLRQLGDVIGHAIAATERKQALLSDTVVELEFRIQDLFDVLDLGEGASGSVHLEEAVSVGDGEFLVYGTADEGGVETVRRIVDGVAHWEEAIFQAEGEETRFHVHLTEPPVLSVVASHGGVVDQTVIEDGDLRMRIHLPETTEVRQVVDVVRESYEGTEMVSRRQRTRADDTAARLERVFDESLTDRQRAALRAAYHAGFFEWPRDATGEEIADSLGVSPPTFHQHLRKAEGKVFQTILSSPE